MFIKEMEKRERFRSGDGFTVPVSLPRERGSTAEASGWKGELSSIAHQPGSSTARAAGR